MKKTSSLVWRVFDRLEENKRCVAVLCKLCDSQYKYFGNTTNLRTHLVNKHPIQWELLQNGTLDDSNIRVYDVDESTSQSQSHSTPRRKRFIKSYKDNNVDVLENSETENETQLESNEEPLTIVRQMHAGQASDEEWLNEEVYEEYQPKRKKTKYRTIKREVLSPPPSNSKYRLLDPHGYTKQSHGYSKPAPERVLVDSSHRKDEYSVFGEYVGNRLRKFKNSQVRGNLQQLITTILWQAEYGLYDNIETVKRVILHSVQEMVVEQTTEQIVVQEEDIQQKETIINSEEN
ncbi:uncharacterized protein LOC112053062 isoform X2 [Bicyclus anynana]|uniref:Uncharacterized protein LOC112053062 isoform X2 n=1 Tax=Bicyclus anynana TaxID=110368 RepID=A0A6J1NTC1_BICAN|nr:uncharacterized protein LOC112053062 isoform X2 [Bicyclus anynana]